MPFFEVLMERQQEAKLYIEADTKAEAEEAAEALVEESDWDDVWPNADLTTTTYRLLPSNVRYWSGGEQGSWVEPPAPVGGGEA